MMDFGPGAGQDNSPLYQGFNLNKRSLSLDLKHSRAMEILERLVRQSDVLIENLRPGTLAGLGLGYAAAAAIRPDIIYCSISGFGQTGPERSTAAYDGAVQAASGMMSLTGLADHGPMRVGYPVVDMTAGMMAAFAISSALFRRSQTGEGQFLDVSMLDAAFWQMATVANAYLIAGAVPEQLGNMSVSRAPTSDVFNTADGFLQVTALTLAQQRAFYIAIGRADLADDPRVATPQAQSANTLAIREEILAALASATAREWVERLKPLGVPASLIFTLPEALDQPQVAHRTIVSSLPASAGHAAVDKVITASFMANADAPRAISAAPSIGQDSASVLSEIGYSAAEIDELRSTRAI